VQRSVVLNIVGLTDRHLGDKMPNLSLFCQERSKFNVKPAFPAVTCTAQATYLTGSSVNEHGIVANGWYSRELAEHQFWKQSNHLVSGKKIWDVLKEENPNFTCAKVFWWYNMYSTADYSITPRPIYPSDGSKVFDVYTSPMGMREEIKSDLGFFPFHSFWGPNSGIESSQWIANSAKWIEKKHAPSLSLVYLPHLDYCLQKEGPDSLKVNKELVEIDKVFKELYQFYFERGVDVTVLSEYGITSVNRPIHLNRVFREKGWIQIKNEMGLEMIDLGASKVFAIADHQIAHIYVNDVSLMDSVNEVLASVEGVESVIMPDEIEELSLNHERSGDIIVVSDEKSWFTYYFWKDDLLAPDYARCVDIHRKPGYDPVELFFDPKIRFKYIKIASKLLKKKLGFRYLMDVIPLNANLIKGSHGRIPSKVEDWPLLIGNFEKLEDEYSLIEAKDVFSMLLASLRKNNKFS
tara:strand:- start:906 stop:2297 length:1392 start_codon:yes stop_codon:yes gene_type:complete